MGVNLKKLIESKEIEIKQLSGKKIGIDGYNWAYQFLSTIRLPDGSPLTDSKGRITSHLIGIFNRTISIMKEGIKPCYVWDGKPPAFKLKTLEKRSERKEIARREYEKAETEEEKMKWAQQCAQLTEDMIENAEKLLRYMGVPTIRAPSEGEAQIAFMVKEKVLDACASQDWDSLLFGAPILIRNLSISGRKKLPRTNQYITVKPEMVNLEENLKRLGITQDQLIIIAMLIGTDYNPGIKGYGPKRAYDIVKKEKTLKNVIEQVGWDFEIPPEEILGWFKNPKVERIKVTWGKLEKERLIKFLVDEHDFSLDRVESQIKHLEEAKNKSEQTGLNSFI